MAITIFRRIINRVRIVNVGEETDKNTKTEPHKISGKIKLNRHNISEVKKYD